MNLKVGEQGPERLQSPHQPPTWRPSVLTGQQGCPCWAPPPAQLRCPHTQSSSWWPWALAALPPFGKQVAETAGRGARPPCEVTQCGSRPLSPARTQPFLGPARLSSRPALGSRAVSRTGLQLGHSQALSWAPALSYPPPPTRRAPRAAGREHGLPGAPRNRSPVRGPSKTEAGTPVTASARDPGSCITCRPGECRLGAGVDTGCHCLGSWPFSLYVNGPASRQALPGRQG